MQWGITFHVEEKTEAAAIEWHRRVSKILEAYRSELVSPSTGDGAWCVGHVNPATNNDSAAPATAGPAQVLQMGPRQ